MIEILKQVKPCGQGKYLAFALCWLLISCWMPSLAAQQDATATEDHLLRQQRSYLLNLMAYSNDPAEKRLAVQRLQQLIDDGQLQQDDALTINILLRLAQQGTFQKSYDDDGNLVNDNFEIRADACNLLGALGGPIAEAGLVSILVGDIEPVIAAVAMENLAKVNPTGNPSLVNSIVTTFYKYHYTNSDNTLAETFLMVIADYAASSQGKLLSPDLLQAVHELSLPSNAYIRFLRSKSRSLVLEWIGGKYPKYDDLK